VCDRENLNAIRQFDVHDVIWEPANEEPADRFVVEPRQRRSDLWVLFDAG